AGPAGGRMVSGVGGQDLDAFGYRGPTAPSDHADLVASTVLRPHDGKPQWAGTEDDLQLPGHPTPLLTWLWRLGCSSTQPPRSISGGSYLPRLSRFRWLAQHD